MGGASVSEVVVASVVDAGSFVASLACSVCSEVVELLPCGWPGQVAGASGLAVVVDPVEAVVSVTVVLISMS